jgi:hypothetical protein
VATPWNSCWPRDPGWWRWPKAASTPPAAGGGELLLASSLVAGAGTAKEVSATERRYRVAGDRLDYDLAMAAVGVPMTHHLHGSLDRVGPGDRGATGS